MLTPAIVLTRAPAGLLLAALVVSGSARAADNPFVGTWKLDPSRSRLPDAMKVEQVGPNRYGFDFDGGGFAEQVVADGSDQPGIGGTTLSVAAPGPGRWKVVRKKDGKVQLVADWTLAPDGKSLEDDFTTTLPNGLPFHVDYVYRRTATGSGFVGGWESTRETVKSPYELRIQTYAVDGLAFTLPSGRTTSVEFDAPDGAGRPANAKAPPAASLRRVDALTVEVTDRIDGKLADTREFKLSGDHARLVMTVRSPGGGKPEILAFDRVRGSRAARRQMGGLG